MAHATARHVALLAPAAVLLAAALAGAGCASALSGPQVLRVPAGFGYSGHRQEPAVGFGGRPVLRERVWIGLREGSGMVSVVELQGGFTADAAERLRDEAVRSAGTASTVAPLETWKLDGLPAWAFRETSAWHARLVACATDGRSTFIVAYSAQDPKLRDEEHMAEVVRSFDRDGSVLPAWVPAALATLVIGGLLAAGWRWSRRGEREAAGPAPRRPARWPTGRPPAPR